VRPAAHPLDVDDGRSGLISWGEFGGEERKFTCGRETFEHMTKGLGRPCPFGRRFVRLPTRQVGGTAPRARRGGRIPPDAEHGIHGPELCSAEQGVLTACVMTERAPLPSLDFLVGWPLLACGVGDLGK
jgi:hypothetical protein